MKEIQLTQGKVAIVDDEDYERLKVYNWCFDGKYAYRLEWLKGHHKNHLMHRQIMEAPDDMQVDHIDHDKLNNQRSNLRLCTARQNSRHRRAEINSTSKYKGVHVDIRAKRWKYYRAEIKLPDRKFVKSFPFTPEGELSAARWYNEMAKEYFGEFAVLNDIEETNENLLEADNILGACY